MLRPAIPADLAAIMALCAAGGPLLSNPGGFDAAAARRLTAAGSVWVWNEAGAVLGVAAVERQSGWIPALLVAVGHDGKGIGRALLAAACAALRDAGAPRAWLRLDPGSAAERHYRAAGWTRAAAHGDESDVVLEKPL